MVRQGRELRSWTDNIMGSDRQIFQSVTIWDQGQNSNHCMLMGCLRSASPREHSNRLGRRTCLLPCPPRLQTRMQAENIFAELRRGVP